VNKSIIDEYDLKNNNRIAILKHLNYPDSLAVAYLLSKRKFEMLGGLVDVGNAKSTMEELKQNPLLQQYLKEQSSMENYESQKQREYVSSFSGAPAVWWNSEIKHLYDAIKPSSSSLQINVSKRLLGYISLNCYGYVNGALHYRDWKAATYFTSIYRQADPENPDCWYALACLQANTGKHGDAIESLKNAIKFGFADFSKIQNDPLLITLQGLPEFKRITQK